MTPLDAKELNDTFRLLTPLTLLILYTDINIYNTYLHIFILINSNVLLVIFTIVSAQILR